MVNKLNIGTLVGFIETETLMPTVSPSTPTIGTKKQLDIGPSSFTVRSSKSILNIISYTTGKWLLGYVIIVVVLSWTSIYARTRWNLRLSRRIQFGFRVIPILLLLSQCQKLLQSLSCQDSVNFAVLPGGKNSNHSDLKLIQSSETYLELGSKLLLSLGNSYSCSTAGIFKSRGNSKSLQENSTSTELTGSLPRLWPLFKTFTYSQFVEAVIHTAEGQQHSAEYVVSLLELFLAFAEEESNAEVGFDQQRIEMDEVNLDADATENDNIRVENRKQTNANTEVLLIGLISAMNHLSNHALAIFRVQSRYRLLNTGIWGLAYMTALTTSIFSLFSEDGGKLSFWRFPSVFIISFIPQMLIVCGMICCTFIYAIALLLTALAPPISDYLDGNHQHSNLPILQRLKLAHRNMQANDIISKTKVNLRMDFYSALLRIGYCLMNMANDAVYLNQTKGIAIAERTWLEENRLQEFESSSAPFFKLSSRLRDLDPNSLDEFSDDISLVLAEDRTTNQLKNLAGGYAREMTARTPGVTSQQPGRAEQGVDGTKQSKRWYFALQFCYDFSRLSLNFVRSLCISIMNKAGIQSRSHWLLHLLPILNVKSADHRVAKNSDTETLNPGVFSLVSKRRVSKDQIDIEAEFRRKIRKGKKKMTETQEKELDASLYTWWLRDGWWGDNDGSGSFLPMQERDEDTSSIISSSTAEDQRWESDSHDENGLQTSTQKSPQDSRETTPINDTTLSLDDLARLLNPKTPDQRAEAEILAAHLTHDQVMTRSCYSAIQERTRIKVLTSSLLRPEHLTAASPNHNLTLEEESQILEHLLITRRSLASGTRIWHEYPWTGDTRHNSPSTPLCVVCHSSPRCIIIWPCRCLSLCNDCRVALAMNNMTRCVCCCRDVASFSRIFVP